MKNLPIHIDEFEKLMYRKGFDKHFLCNASFPGKLRDSLLQHLLEVSQGENDVQPFYLTTYSLWKDETSPYILCDFRMKYNGSEGFRIDKLNARYITDRSSNPNKTIEMSLRNNEELPSLEIVNATLSPRKRRSLKL